MQTFFHFPLAFFQPLFFLLSFVIHSFTLRSAFGQPSGSLRAAFGETTYFLLFSQAKNCVLVFYFSHHSFCLNKVPFCYFFYPNCYDSANSCLFIKKNDSFDHHSHYLFLYLHIGHQSTICFMV